MLRAQDRERSRTGRIPLSIARERLDELLYRQRPPINTGMTPRFQCQQIVNGGWQSYGDLRRNNLLRLCKTRRGNDGAEKKGRHPDQRRNIHGRSLDALDLAMLSLLLFAARTECILVRDVGGPDRFDAGEEHLRIATVRSTDKGFETDPEWHHR